MSVQRDGSYFICNWKIGDSNYGAGQLFWYKTNRMKKWKKSFNTASGMDCMQCVKIWFFERSC